MLANLINVPNSSESWEEFFFNNRQQLTEIRQAIMAQHNVNLTEYVLYPVSEENFQGFLQANQQTHEDFNSVLGLQSSDLETVDPKDAKQLQNWVFLNYQEIFSACSALKI